MSFLAAAVVILRRNGQPLTAAQITEQAIASGLITTRGKTPRDTMAAQLYVNLKAPAPVVRRVADKGPTRARRGTVRWAAR